MSIPESVIAFWNAAWTYITHAAAAIFSAWATYIFTARHFRTQKWHEFDQRRLDEFYGPMLGLINQVRANAQASVKATAASDEAWRDICRRQPRPFQDHDKHFEPFQRSLEYENERFTREDLAAYDRMLEIFKSKLFLSYPSSKQWFDMFCQYVDHWHRPLPPEARMKLNISRTSLPEFYADVQKHADNLRRKLSGEKRV